MEKQEEKLAKLISENQETFEIEQLQYHKQLALEYQKKIDAEMVALCMESIDLVDEFLNAQIDRSLEALLLCRKADYYRYITESKPKEGEERKIFQNFSSINYEKSYQMVKTELEAISKKNNELINDQNNLEKKFLDETECHWILRKLSITLNYAVFLYDIAEDSKKAIELGLPLFNEVLNYLTVNADAGLFFSFLL